MIHPESQDRDQPHSFGIDSPWTFISRLIFYRLQKRPTPFWECSISLSVNLLTEAYPPQVFQNLLDIACRPPYPTQVCARGTLASMERPLLPILSPSPFEIIYQQLQMIFDPLSTTRGRMELWEVLCFWSTECIVKLFLLAHKWRSHDSSLLVTRCFPHWMYKALSLGLSGFTTGGNIPLNFPVRQ